MRPQFMAPAYFAGLVIESLKHALSPDAVVGSGPSEGAVIGLCKVDAVAGMSIDEKQASSRIEAGRAVVG